MTIGTTPVYDGRADIERSIAELAERLPWPLLPLARLAYNYAWSWAPGGAAVFRDIDPHLWRHHGCNPRSVIESTPSHRFVELANQPEYVDRLREFQAHIDTDLGRPWAQTPISPEHPVGYVCSEFGVHCSLPLYGGGLGVLAGDMLKAASDFALPMVAVGLLYRQGYFRQRMDTAGWQHEYWTITDVEHLPIVRVTGPEGRPLTVALVMRGRTVRIQVWRLDVGRVPLFLLDTDREDNHPIDRWITARLYIGDRQTRLAQYAVLGIGGVRALDALGIAPALVHLNEGHGALSSRERLRRLLTPGRSFEEALALLRQATVFTTHTPVAAGNEGYRQDEVEPVLGDFIDDMGIPRRTYYDLGRIVPGNDQEPTNITVLALRTSRAANAVSRRHGEVARAMWHPLWRNPTEAEVPIGYVTNGVHTVTWMAAPMQALLDRHLGADWRRHLCVPSLWDGIDAIPPAELWDVRRALREDFVRYVREQSIYDRLDRGEPPEYVEAAALAFDPDVLTVGFARRMATYKRFYLLNRHPEQGLRLLSSPTPIQLVVAGKAHPQDQEAKEALHTFFQIKHAPEVGRRVVFLEDYDLHKAPRIVAGVDVWLNLPRPPLEASGTSGMKAALNGALNLSVMDGWWSEAYDGQNGWAIESHDGDPAAQDEYDAAALFELLEREVVPLFYNRPPDGIPAGWVQRIKASMRTIIPRFSAERMLREYVTTVYAPSVTA
jgi:glycogen phosphorylase